MRKILVIAQREYLAAVRTKAFVLSLLMMPILMGGSIVLQRLLQDFRDVEEKTFAVVDRTGGYLFGAIKQDADVYNAVEKSKEQQTNPLFKLVDVPPSANNQKAVNQQRFQLSEQVRDGKLSGFLEIGEDVLKPRIDNSGNAETHGVRYQTNRPTFRDFLQLARGSITRAVVAKRAEPFHLEIHEVAMMTQPVPIYEKGLSEKQPDGTITDASESSRLAPFIVPFALLMLMFMVVMLTATPLMQSVVEEKMQRIAEVLLGSVRPFQLFLGKLIGMAGVALTSVSVYLAGGLWAANEYGFLEYLPLDVILWFLVFQILASLMYGSLFIAIGAACSDMKETQNLMWPVMLIACFPFFVMGNVLTEPNGTVATGMSFVPFATPMLMTARQAIPPGVDWWQPVVGAIIVLITTLACVYVAGRIFRVGILMQGQGAKIGEMFRWVVKG